MSRSGYFFTKLTVLKHWHVLVLRMLKLLPVVTVRIVPGSCSGSKDSCIDWTIACKRDLSHQHPCFLFLYYRWFQSGLVVVWFDADQCQSLVNSVKAWSKVSKRNKKEAKEWISTVLPGTLVRMNQCCITWNICENESVLYYLEHLWEWISTVLPGTFVRMNQYCITWNICENESVLYYLEHSWG